MTQEQIGELLGVTGGAVGRYFRAFSQDGYFDRDGPRQDPEYTVSDDAVRLASEFVSDADAVDYPVQEDTLRDIAAARDIDVPLPDAARQEPSPADDATAHESEGYEVADPDEVPSGMRQAVALAAAEIADGHDLSEAADPDTLRDGRAWLDDQGYTDWEAGKLAAAFADEIEPIDLTDGPTPEPHRPYQPRNATKAIKDIFDPDTLVMGRNYRERIEAAAADTPVTPDEVLALPDVSARTLHDRFGLSWDEEEHVPLLHIAEEIAHDRDIEPVVPHLERDDDGVYVVDEEWR